MAWTRAHQTGFEMGRTAELTFADGVVYTDDFSTTTPITDGYSLQRGGGGGIGFQLNPEVTQVRTAFLFKTQGVLERRLPLFRIYCREFDVNGFGVGRITMYEGAAEGYLSLEYRDKYGSVVDYDRIDSTEIFGLHCEGETVISIGLVAKLVGSSWASLYINGKKVLTFNGSADGMNKALFAFAVNLGETGVGGAGMYPTHFDDFYIDTSGGTEPDVVPPTPRYLALRPNADGTATQWSTNPVGPNFENVDDVPGVDSDYNYASVFGNEDRLEFETLALPANSEVLACIPIVRAKAGQPWIGLKVRLNAKTAATFDGAEQDLLTGYTYFSERMLTKPTGGAWAVSDVNGAEFVYELR